MNNQIRIKLGSVTNLSDARFAAAVGVTYIGFCFDPISPFYLPPLKAREIMDWLSGSNLVAEFGNQSAEEISEISHLLKTDAIEVENNLSVEQLLSIGFPVIKKIDVSVLSETDLLEILSQYSDVVDAFHLYSSEYLIPYKDPFLKEISLSYKIIWGLPLQNENALAVVETFKPFAIHLTGAEEKRPGMKDFDELQAIIELLLPQS
jgi:phosphoribosylanthranilate isomerase